MKNIAQSLIRLFRLRSAASRLFSLLGLVMVAAGGASGQTWSRCAFSESAAAACSGDGTTLYASHGRGSLGKSMDAGASWTDLGPIASWSFIACASDGMKVAGPADDGTMIITTNGGADFFESSPTNLLELQCAAWSGSGNQLTAGFANAIYISTNNGAAWRITAAPATNSWQCLASSADGGILLAGQAGGQLFVSTNGGGVWGVAAAKISTWLSAACTADGAKMAVADGVAVGLSVDSGETWVFNSISRAQPKCVATSADGSMLLLGNVGNPFISRDFGATWRQSLAPTTATESVSCSADGATLFADAPGFAVVAVAPPPLNFAEVSHQLVLSWPWPSSRYALQQSPDLSSMTWGGVTNNIVVTNYRNQVVLSRSAANAFYRLQGPNP